jgi:molybdopterin-binding protein
MRLSTRNQLSGTVAAVTVLVKSTEVMLAVE